ncbi:MAG: DUF2461 domain-containing protein [Patescibacteria group bacterium]
MLQDLIKFLDQLYQNNNTEWFQTHKSEYQTYKKEFEDLVSEVIGEIYHIDPLIGWLSVKDCTFRINRDIRFSNDKSPYKARFAAAFAPGGKIGQKPNYYFHIGHDGKIIIGAGIYSISSEQLARLRQNISDKLEDFHQILDQPDFKKVFPELKGETLQKMPRGFEPEDPARDYLKHKIFIVARTVDANQFKNEGEFIQELSQNFKLGYPFIKFLRENI